MGVFIKSDLVLDYELSSVLKKSLCVNTKFAGCVGHCGIHPQRYLGVYTCVFALPLAYENSAQHTLVNLIYS